METFSAHGQSRAGRKILKKYLNLLDVTYQSQFAVRHSKKSSNQETGLGNRGHLKVLNDTKLVLNEH